MSTRYVGIASQHLAWDIFGQNNLMPLTTWIDAINSTDVTEQNKHNKVLHTDLIPHKLSKIRKIASALHDDLSHVLGDDLFKLTGRLKSGKLSQDESITLMSVTLKTTKQAKKDLSDFKVVFWWPNTKLLVDELEMSVSKFESLFLLAEASEKVVKPRLNLKSSGQTLEVNHGEVTQSQQYSISLTGKGNYDLPTVYNYLVYHVPSSSIIFMAPV